MKKPVILLGPTLALTVLLYLLAYYLLPGPAPSAALVLLFAALSLALVWFVQRLASSRRSSRERQKAYSAGTNGPGVNGPEADGREKPSTPHSMLLFLLGAILVLPAYTGSHAGQTDAPVITCSATPRMLLRGGSATISIRVVSQLNRPLTFAYSASAGHISGLGSTATLTTAGLDFGRITIHCNAVDDQGRTASATTSVLILAPEPEKGPRAPQGGEASPPASPPAEASPPPSPPAAPVPAPAPSRPDFPSRPSSPRPPSPPSATVGAPPPTRATGPTMPRVSGTATLLPRQSEEPGYGLYSYALFSREPGTAELPRYKAFLTALLGELPPAAELEQHIPRSRINVTYIPVKLWPPTMSAQPLDARATYMLAHYDYARAAAMLASLPQRSGPGPVITSTLSPLSYDSQPHPVLVQDLSKAQPTLMADYIDTFKNQVAAERFWQPSALADFALSLRNLLETAATGLGMSQDAVSTWVKYLK